jgi:hypothetical protein
MAHFSAVYLTDPGTEGSDPVLKLTIREHESASDSIGAVITRAQELDDFDEDRIPVFYHFEDAQPAIAGNERADPPVLPRPEIPPKLTIIAGPGVSVRVTGIDPLRRPPPGQALIDIFRVQDPNTVPTIGARFSAEYLTSTYVVDTSPSTRVRSAMGGDGTEFYDTSSVPEAAIETYNDSLEMRTWHTINQMDPTDFLEDAFGALILDPLRAADFSPPPRTYGLSTIYLPPPTHVEIHPTQEGVRFFHPYSGQTLELKVRRNHLSTTPRANRIDHSQRYAYGISYDSALRVIRVTILKTANVEAVLSISMDIVSSDESTSVRRTRVTLPVFNVFNADFEDIPPQGAPIVTTGMSMVPVEAQLPVWVSVFQSLSDLAISCIPVLGDAVDIAEFGGAMLNGRDRWGRELATWEKALMGVGAVITLIGPSISVLRDMPELFGRNVRAAERVHAGLEAAGIGARDREFMAQSAAALSEGRTLARADVTRLQDLLRRMPRCTA